MPVPQTCLAPPSTIAFINSIRSRTITTVQELVTGIFHNSIGEPYRTEAFFSFVLSAARTGEIQGLAKIIHETCAIWEIPGRCIRLTRKRSRALNINLNFSATISTVVCDPSKSDKRRGSIVVNGTCTSCVTICKEHEKTAADAPAASAAAAASSSSSSAAPKSSCKECSAHCKLVDKSINAIALHWLNGAYQDKTNTIKREYGTNAYRDIEMFDNDNWVLMETVFPKAVRELSPAAITAWLHALCDTVSSVYRFIGLKNFKTTMQKIEAKAKSGTEKFPTTLAKGDRSGKSTESETKKRKRKADVNADEEESGDEEDEDSDDEEATANTSSVNLRSGARGGGGRGWGGRGSRGGRGGRAGRAATAVDIDDELRAEDAKATTKSKKRNKRAIAETAPEVSVAAPGAAAAAAVPVNPAPPIPQPLQFGQYGSYAPAPFPFPYDGQHPTTLLVSGPPPSLPPPPFVPNGSTFVQPIQPIPHQLRLSTLGSATPSAADVSKKLEELNRTLRTAEMDLKMHESCLARYLKIPDLNPSYVQTGTTEVNEQKAIIANTPKAIEEKQQLLDRISNESAASVSLLAAAAPSPGLNALLPPQSPGIGGDLQM